MLIAQRALLASSKRYPGLQTCRVEYVLAHFYFQDLSFLVELIHAYRTMFLPKFVYFVRVCMLCSVPSQLAVVVRFYRRYIPVISNTSHVPRLLWTSLVPDLLLNLAGIFLATKLGDVDTAATEANTTCYNADYKC